MHSAPAKPLSNEAAGWRRYAQRLADQLKSRADVSTAVIDAFLEVPRHDFINLIYEDGQALDRPRAPSSEDWLIKVYADTSLVVALDELGMPRSSSTAPWLMALMATRLEPLSGKRVLEIGTGTGYNAALLSRLVGTRGLVHTIEIDADLALLARERLRAAGANNVVVHEGDGIGRSLPDDIFDRMVVTAGFWSLRRSWWDRLSSGGVLVGNLRGKLAGAIVVLRKAESGVGTGEFLETPSVGFTSLIGEGHLKSSRPRSGPAGSTEWSGGTDFDRQFLDSTQPGFRFFLQFEIPGAEVVTRSFRGSTTVTLHDATTGRAVEFGVPPLVKGDRSLLARTERAFQAWHRLGRPGHMHFEIRVEPPSRLHIQVGPATGQRSWTIAGSD